MFKAIICGLTFQILVGVCSAPASAQPEEIGSGELLQPWLWVPKTVPIQQWADTLYVMITGDSCTQCYSKEPPWAWPSWGWVGPCIEQDELEFFVSSSGTKYAYDYHDDLLWYLSENIFWNNVPCPGRPVIDSSENLHLIWEGSGDTLYYGFSTDTLSTFEAVDTLVSFPEFVYAVPSIDHSTIAVLFYNSQSDSLYKYMANEGNPIDFSSSQAFYCENNPAYGYDFILDDEGRLIFVFDNDRCSPWYYWGSHDIWTEEYGARFLECAGDEAAQPVCFEIAFGPNDGEILLIAGDLYSDLFDSWFFVTFDGGDCWYRSGFRLNAKYPSSLRTYTDTVDLVYDNSYTSYYYPIPRDTIMEDLTDIHQTESILPHSLTLSNHPNPFNSSTTISFTIPEPSQIDLSVYDIGGRLVNTLLRSRADGGYHSLVWDGTDRFGNSVSSGVYIYRIKVDEYNQSRRMLLLK